MSCKLFVEIPTSLLQAKCEVCKRAVINEPRVTYCVAMNPSHWFNVVHVRCLSKAGAVLGRLGRDDVLAFAQGLPVDLHRKVYDELQMLDKQLKAFKIFPFNPGKAFCIYDSAPTAPIRAVLSQVDKFQPPPWMRPQYKPPAPRSPPQVAQPLRVSRDSNPPRPKLEIGGTCGGFMDKLPTFAFEPIGEAKTCTVCLEIFVPGEVVVALPCACLFHRDCARQCFCKSDECPNDRTNVRQALKMMATR